jgi:mannosyltransferase OCH1-like enzyme
MTDAAIPKRIIQTARHRTLPLRQRAVAASLRAMNPDFEWRFFDNADVERFIDETCPQYRKVFDGYRIPIQRYDFFRYLAVYFLGGFYFDLDVVLAEPLDPLLEAGCVFPFEGLTYSRLLRSHGMDWEVGNYAFGAAPRHPFLGAVIENCVRAQSDPAWVEAMMRGAPALSHAEYHVFYTTGPGIVSRTVAENPQAAASIKVLFPEDVCEPRTWNVFGTYGVHLMEGSWRPSKSFVRRRLAQLWEARRMKALLSESRQGGPTRQLPGVPDVS